MSTTTIVMLAIYMVLFGGGSIFLISKSMKGTNKGAAGSGEKSEGFGSRIGFILSTIGMSVGVGAMWRFPMMCAKWGGGAFVLAFCVVCVFIVIPAGWAEIAYGRHYRKGTIGTNGEAGGLFGKIIGWIMSLSQIGVWSYYPAIMAIVILYIFKCFGGLSFAEHADVVFQQTNDSRFLIYGIILVLLLIVAIIASKGAQGIEKCCKVLLPALFVILIVLVVRVCMIPGIAAGIEYYIRPDWSQLLNPKMWAAAAGMALFAVGLGPGCLLVYGRYVDDSQDIATDFITVNVVQLFICILSGFVIIPAVYTFGLDPLMGKGIMFVALPKVFETMPGGSVFMILFLVALLFAGISSSLNQLEISRSAFEEEAGLGLGRTKATIICYVLAALVAIPATWNDAFFAFFDNLVGNIAYCVCALGVAIICGWKIGAKKVREEWYNPTSAIKWGPWVDFLYKYVVVIALLYFTATSIISLF